MCGRRCLGEEEICAGEEGCIKVTALIWVGPPPLRPMSAYHKHVVRYTCSPSYFSNDVAITVPITNKRLSAEPFDFEYGGVLSSSFGFRTNRTYDLVKRSRAQATRDHKSKSSSSSPSPDQELGRHSRQGSLEVGDLPPRLRSGSSSEMGAEERKRGPSGGRKRSLTRDDSRSRLPSISQIQEKFRARLSRSKKVGAERSGHSWFSKSAHKMVTISQTRVHFC